MLKQQAGVAINEGCLSPGQPEAIGIECRNPSAAATAAAIKGGSEADVGGIGAACSGILIWAVERFCSR
jgi:hypothetical protein